MTNEMNRYFQDVTSSLLSISMIYFIVCVCTKPRIDISTKLAIDFSMEILALRIL